MEENVTFIIIGQDAGSLRSEVCVCMYAVVANTYELMAVHALRTADPGLTPTELGRMHDGWTSARAGFEHSMSLKLKRRQAKRIYVNTN